MKKVTVRINDYGMTHCENCGAELLCNKCGDMPDRCSQCGAAEGRQINRCFKMQELCKAVKGVADDCPTIDPESMRPTAHWISDSGGSKNVVCSACNAISFAAYNFCPECGKRMVNTDESL